LNLGSEPLLPALLAAESGIPSSAYRNNRTVELSSQGDRIVAAYSASLLALAAEPARWSHATLWKALPAAERKQALLAGLRDSETALTKATFVDLLTDRLKGFRRSTIAAWPIETLVERVAPHLADRPDVLTSLFVAMHFPARAHLQAALFDSLGLPHEAGVSEDAIPEQVGKPAAVRAAAEALLAQFPGDEALFYLMCIAVLEPGAWTELRGLLQEWARRETAAT
jgi:hypothetical protein